MKAAPLDPERSMKPLLGKLVQESIHLALVDCCLADAMDEYVAKHGIDAYLNGGREVITTPWLRDVHAIPSRYIARIDPSALGQCVAVRLLGAGGWMVGGAYAGNATPRDLLDATFERPDRSEVSEVAFDLMQAMEVAHKLRCADCGEPIDGPHECNA